MTSSSSSVVRPQSALVPRIHGRVGRATERLAELRRVDDDSDGAEAARRVAVVDTLAVTLLVGHLAPHLRVLNEEELIGGELLQAGQALRVIHAQLAVGGEGLLEARVVAQVLVQRGIAIQLSDRITSYRVGRVMASWRHGELERKRDEKTCEE